MIKGWLVMAATPNVSVDKNGKFTYGGFAGGDSDDLFFRIANTLIYLVGAIAVIMIIIGGFRYVVSGGDPSATKGAKDTILYAVIGLVVAILAFAAVRFVSGQF